MVSNPPEQQGGQSTRRTGIVKQVLSGDSIVVRGQPRGGPPPEQQLYFSSVQAPRLARPAARNSDAGETEDEPYAWEAREFLRKKVIGKEVQFCVDYKVPGGGREYGTLWLLQDGELIENVVETMVAEGLLEVRTAGIRPDDQYNRLLEIEQTAKAAGRGRWNTVSKPQEHIRAITWTLEDPRKYFEAQKHKSIKAVIEFVRDACTVRAVLLPDFTPVMVAMTGIKCPSFKPDGTKDEYADEAKFFTESRLLQRDVEIIVEGVNNNVLIGTIVHPAGSIAEALLRQGFARCVDWSIGQYSSGPEKLRAAEKEAKEKKIRIFKNFEPSNSGLREDERNYSAKVVEINNADSITVKTASGELKKIFLAGVRPPKLTGDAAEAVATPKDKKVRPIYDVPYMYEAREFLRKKLIGQKVDVHLDYVQSARADEGGDARYPERQCCTVTIGDINVGEALLSKGLANVVYYRQDDDKRPSNYDALLAAEARAKEQKKGVHSGKAATGLRISDVSNDVQKAKAFLSEFTRAGKMEGVVDYVGSGSRFRIHIPKKSCLISLILAGVRCPKGTRMGPGGQLLPAEEWGDEALGFSKELCAQRDVQVEISDMDKVGNFIGWVFVGSKNVSLELVEAGLASVNYYSAEKSPYLTTLQKAEAGAKERKLKIWSTFAEPTEVESKQEDDTTDRTENYKRVVVVETLPGFRFFAQEVDNGPKLEALMASIRQEFSSNPPLTGSYGPKRGDICAAKFTLDGCWYRAKVEAIQGGKVQILYIDYGNHETTTTTNLAPLPSTFKSVPPLATEYALAFIREHAEDSDAIGALREAAGSQPVLLNVEYRSGNLEFVTALRADSKQDIGKGLVENGLALVENRREKRLQSIMSEYHAAQDLAKRSRRNIWRYGDITEDDAKEFGYQR